MLPKRSNSIILEQISAAAAPQWGEDLEIALGMSPHAPDDGGMRPSTTPTGCAVCQLELPLGTGRGGRALAGAVRGGAGKGAIVFSVLLFENTSKNARSAS